MRADGGLDQWGGSEGREEWRHSRKRKSTQAGVGMERALGWEMLGYLAHMHGGMALLKVVSFPGIELPEEVTGKKGEIIYNIVNEVLVRHK